MKNIVHKLGTVVFLSAALLFSGCDPEIEDDAVFSPGNLDLSRYVAVGNSLTAGTQDGGLYLEGQINSYPNILAYQFGYIGGGNFPQPLFPQDQYNGSGYIRLSGFTSSGAPILQPVTNNLAVVSATNPAFKDKFTGPTQNLGVPDIKLLDIDKTDLAQRNRYYARIVPNANPEQTYLERVVESNPTFFSVWIGNNDVLSYATSGGFRGDAEITNEQVFEDKFDALINSLTSKGAEGIVMNIPDVTTVPFFTTVGPTAKPLLAAAVAQANAQGLPITGVSALTKNSPNRINITPASIKDASGGSILLTLTSSAYLSLVGQPTGRYWRELAASLNPANPTLQLQGLLAAYQIDTTRAFGLDPRNPIPSAFVLDDAEQKLVNDATTAFNNIMKTKATEKGLAFFDTFQYFNTIQKGMMMNGVVYSANYITGHLFSLDGVHLTPRGYAIAANEMIRAINSTYSTTIPTVNVTQFRTVLIP